MSRPAQPVSSGNVDLTERLTIMLAFIIIMLLGFVLPIAAVATAEWRHPYTRQDQCIPSAPRNYYGMGRRS